MQTHHILDYESRYWIENTSKKLLSHVKDVKYLLLIMCLAVVVFYGTQDVFFDLQPETYFKFGYV